MYTYVLLHQKLLRLVAFKVGFKTSAYKPLLFYGTNYCRAVSGTLDKIGKLFTLVRTLDLINKVYDCKTFDCVIFKPKYCIICIFSSAFSYFQVQSK